MGHNKHTYNNNIMGDLKIKQNSFKSRFGMHFRLI